MRIPFYRSAIALSLFLILLVGLSNPPFLRDLDNLLFDTYQRWYPRPVDPRMPVRIVDIDEESLRRMGQWPWSRAMLAKATDDLAALGASVVAFDIAFAEPDARSPEQVLSQLPPSPGRSLLEQEVPARPSNDDLFAGALRRTPTVLGSVLTNGKQETPYPIKSGVAVAGDEVHGLIPRFTGAVLPLPALSGAAAGIGALNWLSDRDQVVRRVPLILDISGTVVPAFATEILRVASQASTIVVRTSNASGQSALSVHSGVNAIKVGNIEISTDPQAEFRVHFSHSDSRRFLPAWKLVAGEIDRADIEDRVVIVGTSAAGLVDLRATPLNASVAGAEIHAQVIEQILAGQWLVRPDWARGGEIIVAFGLAIAMAATLPHVIVVVGGLVFMGMLLVCGAASWFLFSRQGLLIDPLVPAASAALTYMVGTVVLYIEEQRRRNAIREAFGRYVSPAVVKRLADHPEHLVLGGESRELTILFSDVRDFTTLADSLDAARLAQFMNEYLTRVTSAILAEGGTIDKYIGDAVMAFWNAPLPDLEHARHSVRAAIGMLDAVRAFNAERGSGADAQAAYEVKIGIGIATGLCAVGNFGSAHRFDYSAMGDTVNVAARLEQATKGYRLDLLVSQTTRDLLPGYVWMEVDTVRLKGKREPTRIYTIAPDSPAAVELLPVHARMIEAYRNGQFDDALPLAKEAGQIAPSRLSPLYDIYIARCERLAAIKPPAWDGISEAPEPAV